jgi:hypothetical protein
LEALSRDDLTTILWWCNVELLHWYTVEMKKW